MPMLFAADYPFLDVFWTMILFFLWMAWIWCLVLILSDVFRRDDLSGWGKAAWTIFIIVVPFLGVLVYLIAHGQDMGERNLRDSARYSPPAAAGRRRSPDRQGQGAPGQRHDQRGRVRPAQGEGAELTCVGPAPRSRTRVHTGSRTTASSVITTIATNVAGSFSSVSIGTARGPRVVIAMASR